MLLSIDEKKVSKELAASGAQSYIVTSSNVGAVDTLRIEEPELSLGGTMMYGVYRAGAEARASIASSRRKIEESGSALKTVPDLMEEIDEMRSGRR
jgi:hypothetical protein